MFALPLPSALKITSITRLTNGTVRLEGLGLANRLHALEASPDLGPEGFDFLANVTPDANGVWHYEDAEAAELTKRFYRLVLP